jgi:hypothetical protein
MTRNNKQSKPRLIAFALGVALAMGAGLVRGPTDEDVLADAVREVAFGDAAVSDPATQPALDADQRPYAIKVIANNSRFIPKQNRLEKGQALAVTLTSTDGIHPFPLRALKIGMDLSLGATTQSAVQNPPLPTSNFGLQHRPAYSLACSD